MSFGWIVVSSRWDLATVQAALNVFISVLATFGIWSISRFWWQKGSERLLRKKFDVPLPSLCAITGPGDGWELVYLLRTRLISWETWHLILQLVIIIILTIASTFAGPISKNSTRSARGLAHKKIDVLQATKGDGFSGNLLLANVLWNNTIVSLNQAGFPEYQLLDYVPPSTVAWTYNAKEWDPTWRMECEYTPETVLDNVTGSGNYTFYDPINAFPAFRDTYDTSWLDSSEYRIQGDFNSWQEVTDDVPFKEALFFVLIQSDPEIDDRMYANNETLRMSISALHARGFRATNYLDTGQGAATEWKPIGPVQNASFTRTECNITRKEEVVDENAIPWIWTNDTYSIILSFQQYYIYNLEKAASKGAPIPTPTPEELLRFYQVYMVSVNTAYSLPSPRIVSVWEDTVQLSVFLLVIITVLTASAIWLAVRYFIFVQKFKSLLEELCIPDGKIEWMVHCAKLSASESNEENTEKNKVKDGDYFRGATFGYDNSRIEEDSSSSDAGIFPHRLPRVYTRGGSVSIAEPSTSKRSVIGRFTIRWPLKYTPNNADREHGQSSISIPPEAKLKGKGPDSGAKQHCELNMGNLDIPLPEDSSIHCESPSAERSEDSKNGDRLTETVRETIEEKAHVAKGDETVTTEPRCQGSPDDCAMADSGMPLRE